MFTFYHGTMSNKSNQDIKRLLDFPRATKGKEGARFYVTDTTQTAAKYGSAILSWSVSEEFMKNNNFIKKPIDERYLVGLATYEECSVGGFEYALTQRQADELVIEAIDTAYFVYESWTDLPY